MLPSVHKQLIAKLKGISWFQIHRVVCACCRLVAGFGAAIAFIIIELTTFILGLTMFSPCVSLICILFCLRLMWHNQVLWVVACFITFSPKKNDLRLRMGGYGWIDNPVAFPTLECFWNYSRLNVTEGFNHGTCHLSPKSKNRLSSIRLCSCLEKWYLHNYVQSPAYHISLQNHV